MLIQSSPERPLGSASEEIQATLPRGTTKLRPQDWKSGETSSGSGAVGQQESLWVVEIVAPFSGADEVVKDLKANLHPGREVKFQALGRDGMREVRVA